MIQKPLDTLTTADITALIENGESESKTLEFKRELPGMRDEDKREFLADVSAFANANGGDLIFGITQSEGTADCVAPMTIVNTDVEQQRLEAIIRSGLEPRLIQYEFKWIPISLGNYVLVLRISQSWASPHRVTFREHSKFYTRSSTGKYPMDVSELRSAFSGADNLAKRIRDFRQERNGIIADGETPIALNDGPKLVFHILPLSAFRNPITVSPNSDSFLPPLGSGGGFNYLHTLEGFSTYSGAEDAESSRSYTLIFRNGVVEAAAHVGTITEKHGPLVYAESVEEALLQVWNNFFTSLAKLKVEPPFYVAISLLGVRGYALPSGSRFFYVSGKKRVLNRDVLYFPEVLCESAMPDSITTLKPLFDMFWQAFGYAHSFSFNEAGEYVGLR